MSAFTKQLDLLRETAAMAFDTLRSNKMRSALTVVSSDAICRTDAAVVGSS